MIDQLKNSYSKDLSALFNETLETFSNLPWNDKNFYSEWLAQTYFMVAQTPRLICLAAARFGIEEDSLHRSMVNHFSDEDKHEYVILDDLKNLGFSIEDFSENPETQLIHQKLFYSIDRIDPVAIFGRILFLEMLAASIDEKFLSKIEPFYRAEQYNFLRIHLEEDIEHVKKAMSSISGLSEHKQLIIGDEFYMTGYLYQEFMKGLLSKALRKVDAVAA